MQIQPLRDKDSIHFDELQERNLGSWPCYLLISACLVKFSVHCPYTISAKCKVAFLSLLSHHDSPKGNKKTKQRNRLNTFTCIPIHPLLVGACNYIKGQVYKK